jgi:hypothetical protein
VIVAALVAVMSLTACHTVRSSRHPTTATSPATPSTTEVSVAALASGQWSTFPLAPIAARDTPSVAWTGRELLVWGGVGLRGPLYGDGAAYNPAVHRWRVLAPAPLTPRNQQTAVWTGRELLIWGGYDTISPGGLHLVADGAAYRPDTDTWRRLPPAPLSARSNAVGAWTGSHVVILGGGGSPTPASDGASYEPRRNRWTHIAAPVAPADHPITWGAVIEANGRLLAWSNWTIPDGPGGSDLFAFTEQTRRWRLLGPSGPLAYVDDAIWTGHDAMALGPTFNCACPAPPAPEVRAAYDPRRNRWTQLPPDPLERGVLGSAWTGSALVSFDAHPGMIPPQPARASAYDPRTATWTRLPDAPDPCTWYPKPFWTRRGLIVFCSIAWTPASYSGLAFDVGT